jgi:hypothetical protein
MNAKNTYSIPGEGDWADAMSLMGHLLKCSVCGKAFVVEIGLIGTNHNAFVNVICMDCYRISDEFRKSNPQKAEEIETMIQQFKDEP